MKEMLEKIFNLLKDSEKVVFMGVGEEKLTDDGVGPYIISELLNYTSERFLFIISGRHYVLSNVRRC